MKTFLRNLSFRNEATLRRIHRFLLFVASKLEKSEWLPSRIVLWCLRRLILWTKETPDVDEYGHETTVLGRGERGQEKRDKFLSEISQNLQVVHQKALDRSRVRLPSPVRLATPSQCPSLPFFVMLEFRKRRARRLCLCPISSSRLLCLIQHQHQQMHRHS